jgi:hypothetical protein
MNVGDQIAKSLRLIGVLPIGEDVDSAMAAACLTTFSDFLDALQTERLTIYNQERSVYDLVAGTQAYTIGSGGTFDQQRPLWIDGIGLINGTYETLLSEGEWRRVADKSTQGFPYAAYYNPNYPLGELSFVYVPSDAALDVAIYWPSGSLTSVDSLTTTLSVPPGWGQMLTYNLGVQFALLLGVKLRPEIVDIAQKSKADIQRLNSSMEVLTFDPALSGRRGSVTRGSFEGGDF